MRNDKIDFIIMENTVKVTDAIIVAAKTENPSFSDCARGGCKSLININGRPAVSYLIDNLKQCELVSRIVLLSDTATFDAAPEVDKYVEVNGSELDSILAGVRAVEDSDKCLIMNADMPLVSSEALTNLLTYAPDSDIVYPIVEQSDIKGAFPGRSAYYVQAKEGKFTGSSCLLFRPSVALSKEDLLANLLNARKNPAMLMKIIGPGIALKLMLSTLGIKDIELHLSRALNLDCRVFVSHYPELFVSIDCVEDIRFMEQKLDS